MFTKLSCRLFVAVLSMVLVGQVSAVPTLFFGGDPGDGGDFEGNFIHAINVGGANQAGAGTGATVVGDAVFGHEAGNSAYSSNAGSVIGNWANPNFGVSSNDNNLEFAMRSIRHGGPGGMHTANLSGLVVGREYQVQLMFTESCCDRGFDISVEGVQIENDVTPFAIQGGITNAPTNGALVTHTFTATDTVANILLNGQGAPNPDKNPILSAVTVEDVSKGFVGNVALGKPIIDGSGAWNNLAFNDNTNGFAAHHVTDGSDIDVFAQTYWLGRQGVAGEFFTLDLGELHDVTAIELLNTHNTQFGDSGTQNFQIFVSKEVDGSNQLIDEILLLEGVLSDTAGQGVITPDIFAGLDDTFRYLRFVGVDFRAGDVRVGLNEIRVIGSLANVPEPATALLGLMGLAGLAARRRRSVA